MVPDAVAVRAAQAPGAVAVVGAGERLSYGELLDAADRVAGALLAAGVRPGDLVGVCLERGPWLVAGLLGVWRAGCAYVPMDPEYPAARLEFMVADSGVSAVLGSAGPALVLPAGVVRVEIADALRWGRPRPAGGPAVSAGDLAYVIYTSGSTGTPKGVAVEHGNVARLFDVVGQHMPFDERDTWSCFHSAAFDFSVWEIWGALRSGGRLAIIGTADSRDPAAFRQFLRQSGTTLLSQTPSAFRGLLELISADDGLWPVRTVVLGGEAISTGEFSGFLSLGADRRPRLFNLYGITEATVHATVKELGPEDLLAGVRSPIGIPLADLRLAVLGGDRRPVPVGEKGELWIGGAGVARGYVNRPELTAERFVTGLVPELGEMRWYRTGDVVRELAGGDFEYIGRIDRQVKLRGFRIELGEIEGVLAGHPAVAAVAVELREGAGAADNQLVAYLVIRDPLGLTAEEVRSWLAARLPGYLVPTSFIAVAELPLTLNGKVDRAALGQVAGSPLPRRDQPAEPQTPLEETLQAIWAEVLAVPAVGRHDNFFTSGGDSMLALRLVAECREAGFDLSIRDLFQHPTPAALAAVATRGPAAGQPNGTPEDPGATAALAGPEAPAAFPASQMQCAVLFEAEREQVMGAYQVVSATRLRGVGELHYQDVADALRTVTERNIALRISFDLTHESPAQVVHPADTVSFTFQDLSGVDEREQEQRISATLDLERATTFDTADYPLWRVTCLRVSLADLHVILIHHHALLDGWSVARFFDQFEAALLGRPIPAAPPGINERAVRLEAQALEAPDTVEFWQAQAAAWRPLPTTERTPLPGDPAAHIVQATLDREMREGVRHAAARWGCSPKHVYLAAHLRALAATAQWREYSATSLVVSCRPEEAGAENVLGMFLNIVPFPVQALGVRWAELVQDVMAAEARLQPHRWFPLAAMVSTLRMPAPTVWLNYTDFSRTAMRGYLQSVTEMNATEMPLTVSVVDDGLIVAGRSDRFSLAECQQILDLHTENLARAVAEVREGPQRPAVPAGRTGKARSLCRGEQREPPALLVPDAVAVRAAQAPGAVAVVGAGERLSYGELLDAADRVAGALLAAGVRPGDLVGVCLERGPWLVAGLLGVWRAGCAYVPMDPEYPAARLEFMVADSGVSAVLGSAGPALVLPAGVVRVEIADALRWGRPRPAGGPAVSAGDLAYVIYTSGSTGTPKGVAVEHGNVANVFDALIRILDIRADSVVAALTTPTFDIAAVELLMPLVAGARIAIAGTLDRQPQEAGAFLNASEATLAQATPTMWAALAAEGWSARRPITIVSGGEVLRDSLAAFFLRQGLPVFNGYGPTETSIYASISRPAPDRPVTIGGPLPNLAFTVLGGDRRPVPVGEKGELWIGGAGVARGYVNRPELTAERFVTGLVPELGEMRWYRTGDVVRELAGGDFEYIGRIDRQVKLRGFRIELGEIEGVLAGHPAVAAVAVELREGAGAADNQLVAYLVIRDPLGLTAEEVRSWLAARLPGYLVPTSFIAVAELPLTLNGKVDRAALGQVAGSPLPRRDQPAEPQTPLEETLQAIWAEVLAVPAVGRHDNFFTSGGTSLLALRLVARLSEVLRTNVRVPALYRNPTPAGLAGWLTREGQHR